MDFIFCELRLLGTCYNPLFEGIGKFLGFRFGLFLNDFHQKLFPVIRIFTKIFCLLNFSKQIKNGLGVTQMLYSSMKIMVCYIHQQHLLTTLFHENTVRPRTTLILGIRKISVFWKHCIVGYYIGTSKNRISAKFLHTLYTIKSVNIEFLELMENHVSAKSILREAVYNEAQLYLFSGN